MVSSVYLTVYRLQNAHTLRKMITKIRTKIGSEWYGVLVALDKLNFVTLGYGGSILGSSPFLIMPLLLENDTYFEIGQK